MLRDAKIDVAVVAAIAGNTPRTIYSNYSSQVSIDEQRRVENAFGRVSGKNKSASPILTSQVIGGNHIREPRS